MKQQIKDNSIPSALSINGDEKENWLLSKSGVDVINDKGEYIALCSSGKLYPTKKDLIKAEANAALIAAAPDMYKALQILDNAAMLFADEHTTATAAKYGNMLAELHNAHMKVKDILQKANPK